MPRGALMPGDNAGISSLPRLTKHTTAKVNKALMASCVWARILNPRSSLASSALIKGIDAAGVYFTHRLNDVT